MNLQSPFGGDFSTSKPKIDGHDEPASPPSVYYRRVAELKVCLATSCEFVPQIYAFAAILSGREREGEREAAGNVFFAASANLVQSVAKILRDTPFHSLSYDVPAFCIKCRIPKLEACLRVHRISVCCVIFSKRLFFLGKNCHCRYTVSLQLVSL